MYKVPNEFYFRIHHIRPRFKNDAENVLVFMAAELMELGIQETVEFKQLFNNRIRRYPGNQIKAEKTISNWRTEISSFFSFVQKNNGNSYAGLRAQELADKQDMIEAFKKFLYFFQYPGAHLKPHENQKLIEAGIKFQPAKYILNLLIYAENKEKKRTAINKAELTHVVFNDLRCTRDTQDVADTWNIITKNRNSEVSYDWSGDVIRYAGDILDYMEIANLLVSHNGNYYLNHLEDLAIQRFVTSELSFIEYDEMIQKKSATLQQIKDIEQNWFAYANQVLSEEFFKTDVLAFISETSEEYEQLKAISEELIDKQLDSEGTMRAKEIGDWGESLVHGHECMKTKLAGRIDLLHLIKRIPTQLAVGYDIKSVEQDGTHRLIEVKTTISSKPIEFSKIHLTPNEWSAAESFNDRYFVYRLSLSKTGKKLFVLPNPVSLYKQDKVRMIPRNGADITFDEKTCGEYEELLEWIS